MYTFAVLPYCNAAPLVHYISEFCDKASLVEKYPQGMLSELKSCRVDAALIPVVDLLSNRELKMVPGLGICSKGPVESVLLHSDTPLEFVKTIQLFPESRTSNMLIKVLIYQLFGTNHNVRFVTDYAHADASIVIGDKALGKANSSYTYDLADMWYRLTNLPFVFAVWAYRAEFHDNGKIQSILYKSKQKGITDLPHLSRIYAKKLNLSPFRIGHYLTECLYYDVGPEELKGISKFRELGTHVNSTSREIPVQSVFPKQKDDDESIRQVYYTDRRSTG